MKGKSLAVKYSEGMEAPYIIAKGKGHLSEALIEIARKHQIPIVQNNVFPDKIFEIPLGLIPEKYYELFAELLAFIYQIQGRL